MFPLLTGSHYGRPSVPERKIGIFGELNRPVRSTYNEPKHRPVNASMHSGFSGGSGRIGVLMKSLDGGALFARHALAKQQKSPLDRSQASSQGYEGIGQMMGYRNQLISDIGSH